MQLAIAVICTGLAATLFGLNAVEVTISQVVMLAIYVAGCWIIDIRVGPTDSNKPY